MGITIHYNGKAKSVEAINELTETLTYFAEQKSWEYWLVKETLKGNFHPSWGYGYGYVPKREDMKKNGIEFFPRMVSLECNGYFHLYDTKYADEVRRSMRNGQQPTFLIDTISKGICINLHPRCETLEFSFDLNTLELANYKKPDNSDCIEGSNGFSCKTQFAGFETHRTVCAIIKATERYIDFTEIHDEANFYHTLHDAEARKKFGDMAERIRSFGAILKDVGKSRGITVKVGTDE